MMATQEPIGWSKLYATTKNQMRAFLMVASTGNFSTAAAAVEMQMAQPSVCEMIKRIEHGTTTTVTSRTRRCA
ncbi:LysR family transcriptional regulator [Arthrobacter sp. CP30]